MMPVRALQPLALQGIYMTSTTVGSMRGMDLADEFKERGGNTIVFDVQNSNGKLAYESQLPLSIQMENRGNDIEDLRNTVKQYHDKGFYMVARFVLFKGTFVSAKKTEWVLKNKNGLGVYDSSVGAVWLDSGNVDLLQYLTDIGREIAFSGVDEIQFDYVRFPEAGKGGAIHYSFVGDKSFTQDETITKAVSTMSSALHLLGVKVGVDVFGIIVWDNISWKLIGQNIAALAPMVDALYPMPYPSHFGPGWGGHKNPADEPYFFVQETTKRFVEQTQGTRVDIRPWLQGFTLGVSNFDASYIKEQIRALHDINLKSFIIWNARNVYDIPFRAFARFLNVKDRQK